MTTKKPLIYSLILFLSLFLLNPMNAQEELPYYQIPDYPEDYSPGSVAARMIDGLGFRYYWATQGLTQKDLDYKPSKDGRASIETLRHIHGMSKMILNAADATPNIPVENPPQLSFEELRKETLLNIQAASIKMRGKKAQDFETMGVIFQRGDNQSKFPYWNLINGMLSDCIYHAGQITLMRRASGNPIHPKVSMFNGKLRS